MADGRAVSQPAELLESREILPGHWYQRYRAPSIAVRIQPGQFVALRPDGAAGRIVRLPLSVAGFDRAAGTVTVQFPPTVEPLAWLATRRGGDPVELHGPLGRGFDVDQRSHHLLLVAEAHGVAPLLALAADGLAAGRRVTLLYGAARAAAVYPSSLLPEEIEYAVATDDGSLGHRGPVTDLVTSFEAWADQAFAAGSIAMLGEVARLARGRDARLGVARLGRKGGGRSLPRGSAAARRRSWLQVAVAQEVNCAAGVCLGCTVDGVDGMQRACREGPVFAADELAWGEPA
jgi:dihydroorotate dehydrogenase electron transfer subunit